MANDVFIVTADASGKMQCAASLKDALTAVGLLPLTSELQYNATTRVMTVNLKSGDGTVLSTSSQTLPAGVAASSVPTSVAFDSGNLVLKNSTGAAISSTPLALPLCQGV